MPQGITGSIAFGAETTPGTAVSDTAAMRFMSCDIDHKDIKSEVNDTSRGAGGAARNRVRDRREVGGTVVFPPSYVATGHIIRAALGSVTSSGSYDHAFVSEVPETVPSLTARIAWGNSGYVGRYVGLKVQRLSLEWTGGTGAGKATATFVGMDYEDFASGTPTTPTNAEYILAHHFGTIGWDSTTYSKAKSLKIDVENDVQRKFYIGQLTSANPLPEGDGRKKIRIVAVMDLTAAQLDTLRNAQTTQTRSNWTITATGPSSQAMAITVHNAEVVELSAPIATMGTLPVTVTWAATDDGSGKDGIAITLTNAAANYYG